MVIGYKNGEKVAKHFWVFLACHTNLGRVKNPWIYAENGHAGIMLPSQEK